ncbi:MAG TPA: peptidoglycan bridge formation glycyltransferase FemA/FemB family protein [Anaerolineales bacterium]|nr:peptidoglycan bridge formation glycyltransferase FemA/FemB family protein [Anaerolineales bacterium]
MVAKTRNGTLTAGQWEAFLLDHPQAHLLQTSAWGELKARHGWSPCRLADGGAGAQILFRRVLPGVRIGYVPRGPVGAWRGLLPELVQACRVRGAFALVVEPDIADPLASSLANLGFLPSTRSIQPRTSLLVDLRGSEDEILARMNQKTRYNIGLAARRGVTVRPWDEPQGFAALLRSTGDRQGFGVHTPGYYRDAFELLHPRGECELLIAEKDGAPLAALMVFARGVGAWYFYGASTTAQRELMPTYLAQWEAMRWARRRGSEWYDLWGIPDASAEALEAGFESRSDGLWGVYRFKRGFGGRWVQAPGAWELPIRPALYRLYRLFGPRHAE